MSNLLVNSRYWKQSTSQGASAALINNAVFNRLVAIAFDIPKGVKGTNGEDGLFGEAGILGEQGATGATGSAGPTGLTGVTLTTGRRVGSTNPFASTSSCPDIFENTTGLVGFQLNTTVILPGPGGRNTSNQLNTQWNQMSFVQIKDDTDTPKFIPAYWHDS